MMLAIRRIALRALSGPSPWHATTIVPTRSLATIRAPSARQVAPSLSARIPRRWITGEEQRTASDEAMEETSPAADDTFPESSAPLRSEPLSEEIAEAEQDPDTPDPQAELRAADEASGGPGRLQGGRMVNRPPIKPTPSIYVGNLFYDVTEGELRREFEKIGPVKNIELAYDRRGLSKGHAYIEYGSTEEAQQAIDTLNQQVFEGRRMIVNFRSSFGVPQPVYRQRPSEATRTLFIGNMSYEMTDQDLNDLFRDIRNVVDVRVSIDRRTGTLKGFAHADFTDVQSAERAARILERKRIYGRQLRVDFSASTYTRESSPASESGVTTAPATEMDPPAA